MLLPYSLGVGTAGSYTFDLADFFPLVFFFSFHFLH